MPLARPVVFPLFPINPDGTCGCGVATCSRIGKHPAVTWAELTYGAEVPKPAPGAGAGIKTGASPRGSGVIVVDLDGPDAIQSWLRLGGDTGAFACGVVETPRGAHLYFDHPGFPVRNSAGMLAPGIDIRGDGGFVVAPGSPHRSGEAYGQLEGEIGPAPEWLLEWLRARPVAEVQTYAGDVEGEERTRRCALFVEYLSTAPPAVQGQGGDGRLFDVVQRGAYDLALPVDDVLKAVAMIYNPRCSPPWSETELRERVAHKAHDAKTRSTRTASPPLPADLEHLGIAGPPRLELPPELIASPAPLGPSGSAPNPAPIVEELGIVWGGWDEPIVPPDYLVDKLIPVGTVGIFVAKGSSLKTWAALSIGADVSQGQPWLGVFETKKRPVVLIDYESGRWIIASRMKKLGKAQSPDLAHANFPDKKIDDVGFWRDLARVVHRRGVGLVIVDSFAAGAAGIDENEAKSVIVPLQLAGEFAEKLQCSVLFIHHAKKGEGGDTRDQARGSSAIYAGCDWMYRFDPLNEERTKMRISCSKPWGPTPADVCVELTGPGELRLAADEGAEEQAGLERKILQALAVAPAANLVALNRALGRQSGTIKAGDVEALVVKRKVAKLPHLGYVLDNETARRARILAATRVPGKNSAASVARTAAVDEAEVDEMLAAGDLLISSAGLVPSGTAVACDPRPSFSKEKEEGRERG